MSEKELLALLLDAYIKLNNMRSCEPGDKSQALWNSIDFIRRQIREITKRERS